MTVLVHDPIWVGILGISLVAASAILLVVRLLTEANHELDRAIDRLRRRMVVLLCLPAAATLYSGATLIVFAALSLTGSRLVRRPKRWNNPQPPRRDSASIVIPNWNGKPLLEQSLPALAEALAKAGGSHEVIIVDNASTDDSREYVADCYPQFKLLPLDTNRGYAGACNEGARAASRDIIVLLNNDMIVDENFLPPLLEPFRDEKVFAVSSQIFLWDRTARREETGRTQATFRHGFLHIVHAEIPEPPGEQPIPVLYAGGGSSAFDRRKFLLMGGYDEEIFQPFYGEDCDLSLRAWNRGWVVYCEPRSIVFHKHRGTIGTHFSEEFIRQVVESVQLFLLWKNVGGPRLILSHALWLWVKVMKRHIVGDYRYGLILLRAMGKLPAVAGRRMAEPQRWPTTSQLLETCGNLGAFREAYEGSKKLIHPLRKKILFICPYIPSIGVHAGAGRMFSLIRLLSQTNDISVVTFLESEEESRFIPPLQECCKRVVALRRVPGRFSKYLEIWPHGVQEFHSHELGRRIREILGEEDFDVIQAEYIQMAQYLPQTRRAVTVLTEHEVAFFSLRRKIPSERSLSAKLITTGAWLNMLNYEVKTGKNVDCIVTLTDADRRELSSYDPRLRVEVVPTGVDCSYFAPRPTPEEPHSLVFVGYYRHYPNVDGMLRFCRVILPLIREVIPEVKLYIVGSDPSQSILDLHNGDDIVVTGRVPDIRPYIAKSAVYVVPLWLGVGIRGKILEAWGMGKPVVSTFVGAQGIAATDGLELLVADDPSSFASQVIRLLRDEDLRRELGRRGRRQAEVLYDWPSVAAQHDRLYDALLRKREIMANDEVVRIPTTTLAGGLNG